MNTSAHNAKRSRQRTHQELPAKLEHKLFAYGAVASAAGVGMLALAQPAQASVVFTRTHQTISPNTTLSLDLNNDGVVDFTIIDTTHVGGIVATGSSLVGHGSLAIQKLQSSNQVVGKFGFAAAIGPNKKIGPPSPFEAYAVMPIEQCDGIPDTSQVELFGFWINQRNRYLGLKFTINGEVHYGWARLSTSHFICQISAVMTGYAYETQPNTPIVTGPSDDSAEIGGNKIRETPAPAPASLGVLSKGIDGLTLWRREKSERLGK